MKWKYMSKNNDLISRYIAGIAYDMLYDNNMSIQHTIIIDTLH